MLIGQSIPTLLCLILGLLSPFITTFMINLASETLDISPFINYKRG